LHCLISLHPTQNIADIIKSIKGESSRWINQQGWFNGEFEWQDGYGAISISPQHYERTIKYIYNQELHHASSNLDDELKIFEQFSDETENNV
jgi:REP element-mobilizing transposase RayT